MCSHIERYCIKLELQSERPSIALEITNKLANRTLWFFDANSSACGMGAVGAINNDESGNETIAGFTVSGLALSQRGKDHI